MSTDQYPTVSIVIPVYNDPDGLQQTLDSVIEQSYPTANYEIIIVDNDSTDRTLSVARSVASAHPDLVRVERETDIQSSYAARNTGIEASTGELLGFIDADVVADSDWIETAVSWMETEDADYAGCRVDVECSERTCAGLYDANVGFPVERYVEEYDFAPTCALFVSRDVVRDVGLFDDQLVSGGDVEFGQRVADSGRTLQYVPGARVVHPARSSLRSLLGKHLRVGRGHTEQCRRYPDRYDETLSAYLYGVLPHHPRRFPDAFDDEWDQLSVTEQLGTYTVGYLVRLARTAGRVAEHLDTDGRPA